MQLRYESRYSHSRPNVAGFGPNLGLYTTSPVTHSSERLYRATWNPLNLQGKTEHSRGTFRPDVAGFGRIGLGSGSATIGRGWPLTVAFDQPKRFEFGQIPTRLSLADIRGLRVVTNLEFASGLRGIQESHLSVTKSSRCLWFWGTEKCQRYSLTFRAPDRVLGTEFLTCSDQFLRSHPQLLHQPAQVEHARYVGVSWVRLMPLCQVFSGPSLR